MTIGEDHVVTAKQNVQLDIERTFLGVLRPQSDTSFAFGLHDSDLEDDLAFATSDQLVVVPWRFPCTQVGTFLDVPATNVDLELRGTTFVDIRKAEPDWTYYRYIDFIGALHQMGISTNGRPVVADEDDS
jgi:hypothetical protein